MFQVPYEEIIAKIKEKTQLSDEEIKEKIKAKQDALSGLITEQGAAQIVASELGVNIYEEYLGPIKINKILPGMRNIETQAKILTIYPIKQFTTKDGREGKVASLLLGDETGMIRLVLWNDLTSIAEEVKEGDILQIKDAAARNNQGRPELQIFSHEAIVINPEGVHIEAQQPMKQSFQQQTYAQPTRVKIEQITGNEENIEVLGNIVGVFDPRFFALCPICRKKLREDQGKYYCHEHGEQQPDHGAVVTLIVDDGTGSIRTVLFTKQFNALLQPLNSSMTQIRENPEQWQAIKDNLLGEFIKIIGKSSKNEQFQRIELRAQRVFLNPNPEDELKQ